MRVAPSRRPMGQRLALAIAFCMAILWAVPGVASGECAGGPTCSETVPAGIDGLSMIVLVIILVGFGTLMAVAEARRR